MLEIFTDSLTAQWLYTLLTKHKKNTGAVYASESQPHLAEPTPSSPLTYAVESSFLNFTYRIYPVGKLPQKTLVSLKLSFKWHWEMEKNS